MSKVWIAQCVCERRHAILAAAAEADNDKQAQKVVLAALREKLKLLIRDGTLNPWCGICVSPRARWLYEIAPTPFNSMKEAMPVLQEQALNRGDTTPIPGKK